MIVFRSEVAADVMMFGDVAKRMLELIGKECGERGVITVEQIPAAVAALRAAIAADKARYRTNAATDSDAGNGPDGPAITLAQRALPFVEQLELSLKRGKPVTWGI